MRLPLAMLEVFVAIARAGSLRGAADALGLKPSTVSHQLKTLEDRLGTPLFARTTRSVTLTGAGRALLRGADPAFEQLSAAVDSARGAGPGVGGTLRLTMPEAVYHLIVGPALPSFAEAFPGITLDLSVTDAIPDIMEEGQHAGFRIGDSVAGDMVTVPLTRPVRRAVLGSPGYLSQYGRPVRPADLLQHRCIRHRPSVPGPVESWRFRGPDGAYAVDVTGPLIAGTLSAVLDAARNGVGLAHTVRDIAAADLRSGALVSILVPDTLREPGISLYHPREYRGMVPLQVFLDHLRSRGQPA